VTDCCYAVTEPRRWKNGNIAYSHAEKMARGWVKRPHDAGYTKPLKALQIIAEAASDHGLPTRAMFSKSRKRRVCIARYDAMARLYERRRPDGKRAYPQAQIAFILGMENHTSVIHGLRCWAEMTAMREAAE
jgi:chromosomal replication initiation ATPase DnaA